MAKIAPLQVKAFFVGIMGFHLLKENINETRSGPN